MGALLALGSALAYGLSDFVGGLVSRRVSFLITALVGQVGGLVSMAVVARAVSGPLPAILALVWGGLSGVGTGVAMVFLFRGMSRGAMSVVVPVSAVGGVVLPVLVDVAVLAEHPAALTWVGIAIALPGLWLVGRGEKRADGSGPGALGDGLIAGVGIAVQYLALARSDLGAGMWPVVAGRFASVLTIAVLAVLLSPVVAGPDSGAVPGGRPGVVVLTGAATSGVLAGLALTCYLLATHSQMATIAVMLSSLYPVVPVLLGIGFLRERLRGGQVAGLVASVAASILIATA